MTETMTTTMTMTLNISKAYYDTMAAAENVRLVIVEVQDNVLRFCRGAQLALPFRRVTGDIEKLVSMLEKLESLPSSILLEEEMKNIPYSLQQLFRIICRVIEETESLKLHEGIWLRAYVTKLGTLSEQINDFATRFRDAQALLSARVAAEEIPAYQEAVTAYINCTPVAEQASKDDVEERLLHF